MTLPVSMQQLVDAGVDCGTIQSIATSAADTVVDRLGQTKLTMVGACNKIGFEQSTAYSTSGQTLSRPTQTVSVLGVVYAPAMGTVFPFTTSGTFNPSLWRVVSQFEAQKIFDTLQTQNMASLRNIVPTVDGQMVSMLFHTVKGYGSGNFIWDASSTLAHDNGYVVQLNSGSVGRFIRVDNDPDILAEAYGAVPDCNGDAGNGTDSTSALQSALNKASSIGWVSGGAYKVGGRLVRLPTGSGGCRFTTPLRYGAYSGFTGGDVKGGFAFTLSRLKSGCVLVADLSIQDTWAIDTDTYNTTNGAIIAFNDMPSGNRVDSGLVTINHGTVNKGYSLIVATGKRIVGGLRLIGAPQSYVDIFVQGADISVGHSSCWDSDIKVNSLHNKCGVFTSSDGNSVKLNGYLNKDGAVAPLASSTQFFDIFTPDTGMASTLKDKVFGAFSLYSQGMVSESLTCEGNDYAHGVFNSQWKGNLLYAERTTNSAVIGFTSTIGVDVLCGASNGSIYSNGVSTDITIGASKSYLSTSTVGTSSLVNSKVKLPFYASKSSSPILVSEDISGNRLVYVDSSNGDDANSGLWANYPMRTLDAAMAKMSYAYDSLDASLKYNTPFNARFILSGTVEHYISSAIKITGGNLVFEKNQSTVNIPQITFGTGYLKISNTSLLFNSCNIVRTADLHGGGEEGAIWCQEGTNTIAVYGGAIYLPTISNSFLYLAAGSTGDVKLSMTDMLVNAGFNSFLVQTNASNAYPHTTTVIKAGGSMSGGIEGRSDKGVAIPAGWIVKQIM